MEPIAERLAEHFLHITPRDVPEEKLRDVKRLILDYLGVTARGSVSPAGLRAAAFVREQGGVTQATVIGGLHRCPPMLAAFVNAISNHGIEMDDVDHLALFHFGPPVVSAALAAAEKVGAGGEELLMAAYSGCELMARLSNAVNPKLRDRGFHTTPVCGVFGAALAAGRLLGLSTDTLADALGLAGSMSAGLMEMYGPSLQKRFNPGPTAQNGVMAAELARQGFTGAHLIFEGERGWLRAFGDPGDPTALTRELGSEFPVDIEFKRYSSARPIHTAVDCALNIRRTASLDPADLVSVRVWRHPSWAHYHLSRSPSNINEAQVSLPYAAAVAFLEGDAFLEQYEDRLIHDPDVAVLMEKIQVEPDDGLPAGVSCRMTAETRDGAQYTSQVDYPRGSIPNPMTDDEFITKFKKLGSTLLTEAEADRVAEAVFNLEKQASLAGIMELFQRTAADKSREG